MRKIGGGENIIFVYDAAGRLAAEYNAGEPVSGDDVPRVSYLTNDHLGSPRIVTDANGGVVSRKDFAAFGDETITSHRTPALGYPVSGPDIRQDYTGYQKDGESGLEFAQARYYNSQHGRFTSVDPLTASATIRNPQSLNRYSYVLNSPYKFTDPLGLFASSGCQADGSYCSSIAGGDYGGLDKTNYSASLRTVSAEFEIRETQQRTSSGSSSRTGSAAAEPPPTTIGDPKIVFEKIEVYDVLDDIPTSTTTPPLYGDSSARVTPVELGYNPGASTFFVKVMLATEGNAVIKNSLDPERPDIQNTRVEANASPNNEGTYNTANRKLNLTNFPGSSGESQRLEITESGKSATLTFAVKLSDDAQKNNTFTIHVYGTSKQTFGPRGQLNTTNFLQQTLKIRFELPKPKTPNILYKNPPPPRY